MLVNVFNASTSAVGIKIDPSTTGTGFGIQIAGIGGNAFRGISWAEINTTNDASSKYGIYQVRISGSTNASNYGYGIYQ